MIIKLKNNILNAMMIGLCFLATLGFLGIYSTLEENDPRLFLNILYYFCSTILIFASIHKLRKLDVEMIVSSDEVVLKEMQFFFKKKYVINKNEIDLIKIKYNSFYGGSLNLILKSKKNVSIHIDILEIEEGVLPDVELRSGVLGHTNLYYVLAVAKFISQKWNIPFHSNYLKES